MHQSYPKDVCRTSPDDRHATAARNPHVPPVPSTELGELVLIRGLPGSGKSTMARAMVADGYVHFEADMFFTVDGTYAYNPSRIQDAHA